MAQSLVDAGAIGPEEAAKHPSRHVLTSALATRGAFVQVELRRTRLQDGDQLLLCSDGLTDMVAEAEIARVLAAPGPASGPCRKLVELALEAGGKDNVTVVLGRLPDPGASRLNVASAGALAPAARGSSLGYFGRLRRAANGRTSAA